MSIHLTLQLMKITFDTQLFRSMAESESCILDLSKNLIRLLASIERGGVICLSAAEVSQLKLLLRNSISNDP